MQESMFIQLSLLLVITTAMSVLFRALKQPLILSYIAAGFLAGPAVLGMINHNEAFETFSEIGIVLLLFIVGLELDTAVIKKTGKPVLVSFVVKTLGLGGLGFGLSKLLGMTTVESLVIATALTFSSTIIVIKALTDGKGTARLYGQIAIGVLLVEDILATVALLFVTAGDESLSLTSVGILLAKGLGLAGLLALHAVFILPKVSKVVAASRELLYVGGLAWGFGMAALFWWAGFSVEVGALFAGVAAARLPYSQEVSVRLKPLRDFFIVLFFVELGQNLEINDVSAAILPAILFSALVIVGKPLLMLICLGVLRHTKQTSFKAAMHLSQISEFSIILVVLAQSAGLVSSHVTAIVTLTAIITIAVSTYLIKYDGALYRRLQKRLSVFERSDLRQELQDMKHYRIVVIGWRESAYKYIRAFRRKNTPYVVVDFNPDVIDMLKRRNINCIYGDATDSELLEELRVQTSEMVISTLTNPVTNRLLVHLVMHHNDDAIFICHAGSYEEAEALYQGGATYVIMSHHISSEQVTDLIEKHGNDKKAFEIYRQRHAQELGTLWAD